MCVITDSPQETSHHFDNILILDVNCKPDALCIIKDFLCHVSMQRPIERLDRYVSILVILRALILSLFMIAR